MAAFKCKMCGGDLEIVEGSTVCECEFCGTKQTVPTADNEKKTTLFNRANRLRMNAEFDKAAAVYENIVAEFPTEAEAYWGLCLCAYGIEYVDDPATGEKKPTCHRTLLTSIMEDGNFEQACDNADLVARRVYRDEAKAIDRIQKDILSIVNSERPYDVFICYKETDENGDRTEDSVLAQEIYDALNDKGLKVFFARITLEDKLGQQYEPYIYAALSSAKVMLAVGTRFEYYDAVWVKNEWMRFLSMMKDDRRKALIPCYKDLDAYDMPKEFKQLQAQDMGKLGWLQDLTRGVMKLCGTENASSERGIVNHAAVQSIAMDNPTVRSLLQRAQMFLEDGKWEDANQYADRVLDIEPTNARAYMVKLMAERKVVQETELQSENEPLEENEHFSKIMRFADNELKGKMKSWNDGILLRQLKERVAKALTMQDFQNLQVELTPWMEYQDAKLMYNKCEEEIKRLENKEHYLKLANEQIQVLNDELEKQKAECRIASQKAAHAQHALLSAKKEAEDARSFLRGKQAELRQLNGLFDGRRRKEVELLIYDKQKQLNDMEKVISQRTAVYEEAIKSVPEEPSELEVKYQTAGIYLNFNLYEEAYKAYIQLRGYKDSDEILNGNEHLIAIAENQDRLFVRTPGNYIQFGTYPQNYNHTNSRIEWLVLDYDEKNRRSLLVSRHGLDTMPYNTDSKLITWEKCSVRKWLNSEFLKNAFNEEEQTAILTTTVNNSGNQACDKYATDGGNNTEDKVFLLSYADVEGYFANDKARQCAPTDYALSRGAEKSSNFRIDNRPTGWWWLRSPGYNLNYASNVIFDGSCTNINVSVASGMIRPALWLDLDVYSGTTKRRVRRSKANHAE